MKAAELKLGNGGSTLVDRGDLASLARTKWRKAGLGYVYNSVGQTLHRVLLKPAKGMDVDHINGDKLDNRRANLRVCTHADNCKNRKVSRNNKSGHKNVCWDATNGKWRVYMRLEGHTRTLGRFQGLDEALEFRNEKLLQYHGEYARLSDKEEAL